MSLKPAMLVVLLLAAAPLNVRALEPPQIQVMPVARATTTAARQPLVFPTDKPQVVARPLTPRHRGSSSRD